MSAYDSEPDYKWDEFTKNNTKVYMVSKRGNNKAWVQSTVAVELEDLE